jgi:hypothetical protein
VLDGMGTALGGVSALAGGQIRKCPEDGGSDAASLDILIPTLLRAFSFSESLAAFEAFTFLFELIYLPGMVKVFSSKPTLMGYHCEYYSV